MVNQNDILTRIFSSRHFNWAAFGLIAAMILIAYSNTFTASFHFDDDAAISENHVIKQATPENILQIIRGGRPVVYLSIMLNYQLSGLNPVGWHIFNILVHVITSFFVYLFILWTLSLPSLRNSYGDKARRMALFGALLFGVHPIQTESVTYIISRSELLAACFYLAAFLVLLKGANSKKPVTTSIFMLLSSLLAMNSKEWAVTLPALLLLFDFLFLADGKIQRVFSRWYLYVCAALPWPILLNKLNLFGSTGGASVGFNVVTTSGITPATYFYTSLNVIWTYIRLLFLPINQNLDYDYPVAKTLFEMPTAISLAGHLALVAAAFWLYRVRKNLLIPFGIAWFYIGLSPVQSFVPVIDVIFEHRLYMPSIGFILVFIALYEMIFDALEKRRQLQTLPTK